MFRFVILFTGFIVALLAGGGVIWAVKSDVSIIPIASLAVKETQFVESFDDAANVSGSPLVGLRLVQEKRSTKWDPNNVLLVHPFETGVVFCIDAVTQDGRYSALNPFRAPSISKNSNLMRVTPLTLKHRARLTAYTNEQFAIRAYVPREKQCSPSNALHLPQVLNELSDQMTLVIFANGRSRSATADLLREKNDGDQPHDKNQVSSSNFCRNIKTGASIAYDLICSLPLSLSVQARPITLQLTFDDGFDLDSYQYRVLLPSLQ